MLLVILMMKIVFRIGKINKFQTFVKLLQMVHQLIQNYQKVNCLIEFNLQGQLQFIYSQIIHSISKSWKDTFIANSENIKNLVFEGLHLIKNHHIYCLNKLGTKEIYSILIESTDSKPSSQMYYKNIFQNSNLDWKTIYMLPRIVTKDSRLQVFQYKLLNNVLYLNKMLFRFGKIYSPLCSCCKMIEETPLHFFYNCIKTKLLWDQLK